MLTAEVKVPGSCGELVQGKIDGQDFLVTCPINLFSTCRIYLSEQYQGYTANIDAEKSVEAVKKILQHLEKTEFGAKIYIKSELLRGKGMASSTADIAAAIAAVMTALNYEIDLQLIKKISLSIEPTDGIFLPGINVFDHLQGQFEEYLGSSIDIDLLIFSEKGQLDTYVFNQRKDLNKLKLAKEKLVKEALSLVKIGIKNQDKISLGKGATLSSIAHQRILYKPYLERLINFLVVKNKVYGVNIAHSGTVLGILIDPDFLANSLIKKLQKKFPQIRYIDRVKLISGDIKIKKGVLRNEASSRW